MSQPAHASLLEPSPNCSDEYARQHRAKARLGLSSVAQALTGSVAVVQRTDGALRLSTHLHVLALDGVYLEDEHGELHFHPLPTPTAAEVARIARRTARRRHRAFAQQGRPSPWDDEHAWGDSGESDPLRAEQPGLFACYQAAASGVSVSGERAGQPLLRLVAGDREASERWSDSQPGTEPVAEALGVNLYAKQIIDGRDRWGSTCTPSRCSTAAAGKSWSGSLAM